MTGPRAPALTRENVMAQLAVSLSTVQRLIEGGQLTAFKVGNQWRIQQRDLDAYVENKRNEQRKRTGTL